MVGGTELIYELRHFNTQLLQFTATEDSSSPDIKIVWINEEKQNLMPLDLALSPNRVGTGLSERWAQGSGLSLKTAHMFITFSASAVFR